MLCRLKPKFTVKRAPGPPGVIQHIEWKIIGKKHLQSRNVALHTDSANPYRPAIPGIIHDGVMQCKTRGKRNGKFVSIQPTYLSLVKHRIPESRMKLTVQSWTQIIGRSWHYPKERVQINQRCKAGSKLLRAKRSA